MCDALEQCSSVFFIAINRPLVVFFSFVGVSERPLRRVNGVVTKAHPATGNVFMNLDSDFRLAHSHSPDSILFMACDGLHSHVQLTILMYEMRKKNEKAPAVRSKVARGLLEDPSRG